MTELPPEILIGGLLRSVEKLADASEEAARQAEALLGSMLPGSNLAMQPPPRCHASSELD